MEVTGFLNGKSKDDSLLKKVQVYLYVNGGRGTIGIFLMPEAIKSARQICEDLGGWTAAHVCRCV